VNDLGNRCFLKDQLAGALSAYKLLNIDKPITHRVTPDEVAQYEIYRFIRCIVNAWRLGVVEAPFALFEIERKVLSGNAVEVEQMSLCLVPEVFNSIDVIARVDERLAVIDPLVTKLGNVGRIAAE
jgi:hypothetical protein